MSAVIVFSNPPHGFYAGNFPSFMPDLSYRRLRSIPSYRTRLNEAELDSGSIELDNSDGFLSNLFALSPFGYLVKVYDDTSSLMVEAYVVGIEIQDSVLILRLEG